MKKFLSVLVCFILIISICSVPSSAIAIEIIGGSYVAYAVLAAALAAAGYAVATSDVSPEVFQGMLDSPNSELVKALIGGTSMYLTAKGSVYFNWTASQWATFTNWVNDFGFTTGVVSIPSATNSVVSSFNSSLVSNYISGPLHSSNSVFSWSIGATNWTIINSSGFLYPKCVLNDHVYLLASSGSGFYNRGNGYYLGSPLVNLNGYPYIYTGICKSADGSVASTLGSISYATELFQGEINIYYNNRLLNYQISNTGVLRLYNNQVNFYVNNTEAFSKPYFTFADYIADVINTGSLVGSIGNDVINPADNNLDVSIDAYPDAQVGIGEDALPLDLDIGSTIDIPLDRYIDTPIDLSNDPVPIDFTPWQDKTIDTTPDDVIPDVRVNPTTDIPDNPDIPWADTESYPIDYPIDTDTPLLPNDPNPNPSPDGDGANKLKLLPLVLSKFPFCLPWDLYHGVNSFFVTAEAPVFDIPLRSQTAGINETIHIDFNNYQTLANVSRWFFSALWVIILIMVTRKIIWK